jgi:ABC-type glycerol-3-phosphate transport system substrate-binding protein
MRRGMNPRAGLVSHEEGCVVRDRFSKVCAAGAAARGWTRRAALRQAAVGAGALMFTATRLQGLAAAAATRSSGVTTVYFQVNWQQSWDLTAQKLVQEYVDKTFNARHPGVRAIPTNQQSAAAVLAQVLAGDAQMPATVTSCCSDFAVARPMLAKLDPWLSADNLPKSLWSQGQLISFQEPGGLYAVPAYTAPQPLIYNKTLLNELGLKVPDPEWDYLEATAFWRQLAGTNRKGQHRYGTTFQWQPNSFDGSSFLLKGFGGEEMDASHTRCLLDSPQSIAAGEWIYSQVWDKVIINRFGIPGYNGAGAIVADLVGMYQSAGNMLFEAVTEIGDRLQWDVLPMPRWPVRRATNVNVDYFGMNAHYPNQELAWELFKYVAANPEYQRFIISTTLMFPNLMSLWDEWEADINAAAPITRGKQLQWWPDAALRGYGYGREFWRYQPLETFQTMDNQMINIWNRQLSVVEGFTLIAKEVNELQSLGVAVDAQEARAASVYSALLTKAEASKTPLTVPPPPRTGYGLPPVNAPQLVHVDAATATVTVRGAGEGVSPKGPNDALTFACMPWTKTVGTFTCRLVALSPVGATTMVKGGKVGLMARGNLATDAADVFLSANVRRGVHFGYRAEDGHNQHDSPKLAPNSTAGGLLGWETFMYDNEHPAPSNNFIKRPLWLRLVLQINAWTAYTSFDGVHWTELVLPGQKTPLVRTIEPIGVWIGLGVTSHNPGQYIQAVFDHVSGFLPNTFVQIGPA